MSEYGPNDDQDLLDKGYLRLGCPKCRYITYAKPEERICFGCRVELKTVEECEAIIVEEHKARNAQRI